ncbi:MAG: multifunctional fatty acid oxidation complex subunit alpha [Verrucomicrobiaceae bacterium]|nr:multifunctional fatty acid oxidation complex subunit alpha [Verrucomicrobiaceae bacterium]
MLYQGKSLSVKEIEPGITEVCFDQVGAPVNTLGTAALEELSAAMQQLNAFAGLKGVLFTSAKDGFIAGADITEFLGLFAGPEADLIAKVSAAAAILDQVADLPVPTVAAINGVALGGGFELCLAVDYRVLADDGKVGLPEVKLGIHPGFGGTVRLPRLIGCDNAIQWIASGDEQRAADALIVGAVDAVVPVAQLRAAALTLLKRAIAGDFDYKQRRFEKDQPVLLNAIEAMMSFTTSKGYVAAQAGPNMPAPLAAVKTIEKNASAPRAQALAIEAKGFAKLAKTPQAEALIGIFINNQTVAKANRRYEKNSQPVQHAGVLGAGIMGGGIAYQSALKGVPILMKDVAEAGLQAGIAEADGQLVQRVERGRMQPKEMAQVLARIRPTLDYRGFDELDVVVEAVVENKKVKQSVLAECEAQINESAVLASNTSTISITELASVLKRPAQFCGMHFFNPVYRMPLVEVIRGKETSDATVARVIDYAKKMGKTPIVVNDCPGFFVNRVLFPYFAGFSLLVRDGADFHQVDKVMERFGWPMGPAYLLDVVGIDTAHHASEVMAAGFPDRLAFSEKPIHTLLYEQKRFGQKNGVGFYRYEADKKGKLKKVDDPVVSELIGAVQKQTREFTDEEIIARMMIPMCIEVVRCLEEGIVGSPAEADMGLVLGIGFPPFRGGALRYIDQFGIENFVALADQYRELGALYQPTESLRKMAQEKRRFYGV